MPALYSVLTMSTCLVGTNYFDVHYLECMYTLDTLNLIPVPTWRSCDGMWRSCDDTWRSCDVMTPLSLLSSGYN